MSIGTITVGSVVAYNYATSGTQTPSLSGVGSSSSTSIIIAIATTRAAATFSESGAGTWTEFIDQDNSNASMGIYWAAGTETNDPVIDTDGGANPGFACCIRVNGANTAGPIGGIGSHCIDDGNTTGVVGPIAVPTLQSTDGVVFCLAFCRGDNSNVIGSSSSISSNSTGITWVKAFESFSSSGADGNIACFYGKYTSAPTLSAESVTFTGAAQQQNTSNGIMFEIKSLTAYSLTCSVGSFSMSGKAASFIYAHRLTAEVGTYIISGKDAILLQGKQLYGDPATFVFTGYDADLSKGTTFTLDVGAFSWFGNSANLYRQKVLTASMGTYVVSGIDADFTISKAIAADAGSFSVAGKDAEFTHEVPERVLEAEASNFTVEFGTAEFSHTSFWRSITENEETWSEAS